MILGAQLGCANAAGSSLAASGMKVGGGMVLGDGLTQRAPSSCGGRRSLPTFASMATRGSTAPTLKAIPFKPTR